MASRLAKILVVATLVASTGLHWAALQTVAWTGMLADHLSHESLGCAVSDTFDGRHLCPLCRAILAAKKSEKKSEAVTFTIKMEFPPVADTFALISPSPVSAFSSQPLQADATFLRPPFPPPRPSQSWLSV